ncbi:hypothetical protein SAMN05444161_4702 [Rhizobiales bacterium GAS191]|nr:hypothetical protein SAMN05444161_4702 [Rhizobiales bacterium GAS191]
MFGKWMKLSWNMGMLALESQRVIALRLAKLSKGGKGGSKEAVDMVSEKVAAAGQAAMSVAAGRSANVVVKQYRRKVRSNLRRLRK